MICKYKKCIIWTRSGSICDAHSGISSVHWSLDNNGIVPIISGVNSTNNTSGVIELVSLSEGTHEFCIRSIDVVGNLGPVRCLNFTIDSINPNLIVDCQYAVLGLY